MSDDIVEQLRQQADDTIDDVRAALLADAADEIETLRELADNLDERCTKLRELIATWVTATAKWNKAMWIKDMTTQQRSQIEKELTKSINLLIVEAAYPKSVLQQSETDSVRRDLPA